MLPKRIIWRVKIIKDWVVIKNYRFDDYIARSEIMGMVLAMMNVTRNANLSWRLRWCTKIKYWLGLSYRHRDSSRSLTHQCSTEWHEKHARMIVSHEQKHNLMKAYPDSGGWAGYSYYWSSSLPTDASPRGYKDIYQSVLNGRRDMTISEKFSEMMLHSIRIHELAILQHAKKYFICLYDLEAQNLYEYVVSGIIQI